MKLRKHGVVVGCEHCRCVSKNATGDFAVSVPLDDTETDLTGTARLRCVVSPDHHEVRLEAWLDASGRPLRPSPSVQQRMDATLRFVEEHRICGKRDICPDDVVQLVRRQTRD